MRQRLTIALIGSIGTGSLQLISLYSSTLATYLSKKSVLWNASTSSSWPNTRVSHDCTYGVQPISVTSM
jgi:hypothetical protein